jgi:SAM-dependent methyltransferase
LVRRVSAHHPAHVLEVACGTGVVTREMASALPADVAITATDLNPAMLAVASARGAARPIEWREADATALPLEDGSVDAMVCQFGVMFVPDKLKAFAEAWRVLRPGGILAFNVWDRIEANEFADVVTAGLVPLFPADPPRFFVRAPHGYFDVAQITRDVAAGGFTAAPAVETVAHVSRADSAHTVATAFCQGTPLRADIESRDPSRLEEATDAAAAALRTRFGDGPISGRMQAHVIVVPR